MVAMSQEDYLRYWAKDDNGKYLSSVEEPPQGRVEWLRYQIRVNDQWREWGQIRTGEFSLVGCVLVKMEVDGILVS